MRTLNKKKAIIILAVIVLLICGIIGGVYMVRTIEENKETEPTLEVIISSKLHAYETDLFDSKESFSSNEAAANYLLNWGKNKQINAEKDAYNNVIFTVDAMEGYEDAAPVVIICSYDAADMDNYIESAAAALTAAKNARNHGRYTVIFHLKAAEIKKVSLTLLHPVLQMTQRYFIWNSLLLPKYLH